MTPLSLRENLSLAEWYAKWVGLSLLVRERPGVECLEKNLTPNPFP